MGGEPLIVSDTIRVLALSPIPEEGAGCRFRIAQFIPYLRSVGIDVTLRSLFTADFFHLVYKRGHYLRKASRFATLSLKHLASLRDLSRFDAILLYREMFPIGPAVVERLLAMRGRPPVVFDFDDAIFLPNVSDANRFIRALKAPSKLATIIRHSDRVIAGNQYLACVRAPFQRRGDRHSDLRRHHALRAVTFRTFEQRRPTARADRRLDRQPDDRALRARPDERAAARPASSSGSSCGSAAPGNGWKCRGS